MQVMQAVPRSVLRTASLRFPDLSSDARRRLKWITYYHAHGGNAALTCRHFDIPRPTFYRWLNRYDPKNQKSLEDRSSVPKRQRQRTWTSELVSRVKELREKYPAWGKDKLARLIQREGIVASTSMIGRILTHLKRTRQLIEPVKSRPAFSRQGRPSATRVQSGWRSSSGTEFSIGVTVTPGRRRRRTSRRRSAGGRGS
jgi:transposase